MCSLTSVRTLKKVVREIGHGKGVYINATYLSAPAIDQLREYIKENVLLPDETEARKQCIVVSSVMNGDIILPQMTYIKQ